jgi:hypothetical protein
MYPVILHSSTLNKKKEDICFEIKIPFYIFIPGFKTPQNLPN